MNEMCAHRATGNSTMNHLKQMTVKLSYASPSLFLYFYLRLNFLEFCKFSVCMEVCVNIFVGIFDLD